MTFKGSVVSQTEKLDEVEITITNVRRKAAARWRDYSGSLAFKMPHAAARAFPIGRAVKITFEPA